MRKFMFTLLLPIALGAGAQERKPGLYDLTIVTTTVSPSAQVYPPRTMQVCLTQEMIDKYGAIVPENLTHTCQLANVVKKHGGMTADMVCSGGMTGKGTLEVNWTDNEHSRGTLHFAGTIHPRDADIKLEWSAETKSAYKGPDCGAVNPATAPPTPPAAPPSTTPPPSNP